MVAVMINTGFYVSIIRNDDYRLLAGPYGTETEARQHVPHFRNMACSIDVKAIWDAFGTCKVEQTKPLPFGILTPKQTNMC